MTLKKTDIKATVANVEKALNEDQQIAPSTKATISLLLVMVDLMMTRLGMNSNNSSIPPSQDVSRKRSKTPEGNRKPGGQPRRNGSTLTPIDTPDEIKPLKLDKRTLPRGEWREVGYERRQVVDLNVSRHVTEYRAQILENELGQRYVAEFPAGVTRPIQYGNSIRPTPSIFPNISCCLMSVFNRSSGSSMAFR